MRHLAVLLAFAALLWGWAALAFTLLGPSYSTASSSVDSNGVVTTQTGTASLLGVGLDPVAAVIITLLALGYLVIFLGTLAHTRGSAAGRGAMLVAIVPMLVVGAISFGLAEVLPATVLAGLATLLVFLDGHPINH